MFDAIDCWNYCCRRLPETVTNSKCSSCLSVMVPVGISAAPVTATGVGSTSSGSLFDSSHCMSDHDAVA